MTTPAPQQEQQEQREQREQREQQQEELIAENDVYTKFEDMNLKENLLRGI